MKLIALAALFLFVSVVYASTACPNTDAGGFSSSCTDPKNPYCLAVTTGTPPTYQCVACLSNCDCPYDEYCSLNAVQNQAGTCQKFSKIGKSCRPLTNAELLVAQYPDDWKCAIVYASGNVQIVDAQGVCINEKCRYCNYRGSAGYPGFVSCDPGDGTQGERTCIYPGNLYATHSSMWVEGAYYENVDAVWWAIIFVFVFILVIIQLAQCLLLLKSSL